MLFIPPKKSLWSQLMDCGWCGALCAILFWSVWWGVGFSLVDFKHHPMKKMDTTGSQHVTITDTGSSP